MVCQTVFMFHLYSNWVRGGDIKVRKSGCLFISQKTILKKELILLTFSAASSFPWQSHESSSCSASLRGISRRPRLFRERLQVMSGIVKTVKCSPWLIKVRIKHSTGVIPAVRVRVRSDWFDCGLKLEVHNLFYPPHTCFVCHLHYWKEERRHRCCDTLLQARCGVGCCKMKGAGKFPHWAAVRLINQGGKCFSNNTVKPSLQFELRWIIIVV